MQPKFVIHHLHPLLSINQCRPIVTHKLLLPFSKSVYLEPLTTFHYTSSTFSYSGILENNNHPFFVKFLTKQIKLCQECQTQFHSENTDLLRNIILAQLERKVICNPSTGTQIMTKEPPLHYYPQLYPVSAPFVLLFTHQMLIPLSKSNRNTQRIHCLKD